MLFAPTHRFHFLRSQKSAKHHSANSQTHGEHKRHKPLPRCHYRGEAKELICWKQNVSRWLIFVFVDTLRGNSSDLYYIWNHYSLKRREIARRLQKNGFLRFALSIRLEFAGWLANWLARYYNLTNVYSICEQCPMIAFNLHSFTWLNSCKSIKLTNKDTH